MLAFALEIVCFCCCVLLLFFVFALGVPVLREFVWGRFALSVLVV